jgi:hypothetical protein
LGLTGAGAGTAVRTHSKTAVLLKSALLVRVAVTLGLLACTGCCDEGSWAQAATAPAASKAMFNPHKRRKIVIIGKPPG